MQIRVKTSGPTLRFVRTRGRARYASEWDVFDGDRLVATVMHDSSGMDRMYWRAYRPEDGSWIASRTTRAAIAEVLANL